MALNVTSTYAGKDSKSFISPVLQAGVTLGTPTITIKQNVNYKSRITKLDVANIIQDATCDFTPGGDVNITEKWLVVSKFEVNLQLCKSDLIGDFIGEDIGCDSSLPADFLRFLLGEIGATVADAIETQVWQGAGTADTFQGFEPKFVADAAIVDISTPIAPVAATAIAEARRTIAGVTAKVRNQSDSQLWVGSGYFSALKEAFNDKTGASACGEDCMNVDGVKIVYAPGMKNGSMAMGQKSNLYFGTWSASSAQNVKVKDMEEVDLSDNVRFKMCYFAGVAYGYANEIAYYAGV